MSFNIQINNANIAFKSDEKQSILDASHQANILLSYGCKSGFCGSCEAQIISGTVEYPEGKPKGLTEDEINQGKALLCKAIATSDLEIEARVEQSEKIIPIKTLPIKIKEINTLADDVMQIFLQLPSTQDDFEYIAGQWFYFVMKDGLKRAFSIANAPNKNKLLEVHIRHASGGVFTDFVFSQLKVGDILKIEGPQGTFFYHEDYRDILMVAGGTGFAPLKGIIEALKTQDKRPDIHLYWGVRSQKDLYFKELAMEWEKQGLIKFIPVLSESEDDKWVGKTGFVNEAIEQDYKSLKDKAIYMAGPPQMIEACKKSFLNLNARKKNIYFDSFDYAEQ